MKPKVNSNRFSQIAIVIMIIIFVANLLMSDYNLLEIFISGGGNVVNYTSVSYPSVFKNFQLFRLVTYGYTQTSAWHLAANIYGLWDVSLYLEKKIGTIRFVIVYHIGLIVAGIILIVLYPNGLHYGASPAIFACIGVLTNWLVRDRKLWSEYKSQKGFRYLINYFVLSNILGICTLVFHLLGFVVGFLLGFIIKEKAR